MKKKCLQSLKDMIYSDETNIKSLEEVQHEDNIHKNADDQRSF